MASIHLHHVIYFSRGGNTSKLALAIAGVIGAKAANLKETDAVLAPEGIIFLGSGCYAGKASPGLLNFIRDNGLQDRPVALFGTSASGEGDELKAMEGALKAKKATIIGRYHCRGKFMGLICRGHPSEAEIAGAKKFARDMLDKGKGE